MSDRVLAVVGPVLTALGAERDPECWVAWGEDPDLRYSLLAPTLAGMITAAIRFTNPEDGPRVIAKLVRWSKVSISELGLDAGGGHRMVAVQVENLVLKGMDEEADRICKFVRNLIAGVEDRLPVPIAAVRGVAPVVAAPAATAPRASVRTVPSARVVVPSAARVVAAPQVAALAAVAAGGTGAEAKLGAEASRAPKTPKAAQPAAPTDTVSEAASAPVEPTRVPPPAVVPEAESGTAAPAGVFHGPEKATRPTPIAARTAARHATADGDPIPSTKPRDGEPEPEPDRSGWVSPHPIEEQIVRKPSKPRTWMP